MDFEDVAVDDAGLPDERSCCSQRGGNRDQLPLLALLARRQEIDPHQIDTKG